jgi:ubiquinone/menaquinone biosynthesis C-methylase UbiE
VLDVGTGNGAIALIARETAIAKGCHFEIHGTDLAQIDPVRDVRNGATLFSGIRFHPRVATEQLPFEPATFDAVSGQYALEYTAMEAALREIHRVLKAGAHARFIVHHAQSVIVHNARESLEHTDLVLNGTKIFRKLRRHVEARRRTRAAGRETWQELLADVRRLQDTAARARVTLTLRVTVDAVEKLLQASRQLAPAAMERDIEHVENEVRASGRRLRDLIGSAQTAEGMASIERLAAAAGFGASEVQAQYHAGEHLVGWRLTLRKP